MTNGTNPIDVPSAIAGDAQREPGWGYPLLIATPYLFGQQPNYTDLPLWWTPRRDWVLVNTPEKESMWASVVNQAATKFAALGFTVSDSQDSTVRTKRAQDLLHGYDGWVPFATKLVQDYLLTDNGIFIRLRRAGEQTQKVRLKDYATPGPEFSEVAVSGASPGARIIELYHMDSLRCTRTGNLTYPVRYVAVDGTHHLLRWDQVLFTADMISPRAEMYGVGRCAASRAYATISKLWAMEQMVFEFLSGRGANKLVLVQGLQETTLKNIIKAGENEANAKGLMRYLGTILGALPGDTPISTVEILLKQLAQGFIPAEERSNAYLIYAKAVGLAPGEVQPNPAGLNSGKREEIQSDQAKGYGMASFVKWFEQTFSRRVLPETTDLKIADEHDIDNQKKRAEVKKLRAETRKIQIEDGEISPALSRQLAVDDEDLPREVLQQDATAGGQLSDDEKPLPDNTPNPAALQLIQSLPLTPPKEQQAMATKSGDTERITDATRAAGAIYARAVLRANAQAEQAMLGLGIIPAESAQMTRGVYFDMGDALTTEKEVRHLHATIDEQTIERARELRDAVRRG